MLSAWDVFRKGMDVMDHVLGKLGIKQKIMACVTLVFVAAMLILALIMNQLVVSNERSDFRRARDARQSRSI